jgi:hypothetical protein
VLPRFAESAPQIRLLLSIRTWRNIPPKTFPCAVLFETLYTANIGQGHPVFPAHPSLPVPVLRFIALMITRRPPARVRKATRVPQFPQRLRRLLRADLPGLGIGFWSRFEVANPIVQDLPDQPRQAVGDRPNGPLVGQLR